jgi:hypothetical protein
MWVRRFEAKDTRCEAAHTSILHSGRATAPCSAAQTKRTCAHRSHQTAGRHPATVKPGISVPSAPGLQQVFLKDGALYAFKGLAGKVGPIGVHAALLLSLAGTAWSGLGTLKGTVMCPEVVAREAATCPERGAACARGCARSCTFGCDVEGLAAHAPEPHARHNSVRAARGSGAPPCLPWPSTRQKSRQAPRLARTPGQGCGSCCAPLRRLPVRAAWPSLPPRRVRTSRWRRSCGPPRRWPACLAPRTRPCTSTSSSSTTGPTAPWRRWAA